MNTKAQDRWYVTWCIQAHGNQMYGDHQYEFHIRGVAAVATEFGFTDEPTQMVCHAHDVGEDCINPKTGRKYTRKQARAAFISAGFPAIVAAANMAITDQKGADRDKIKAKTLPIIAAFRVSMAETGFSTERPVVLVKLCDRIFNMRAGLASKNDKFRRYQHEHAAFVAALYDPKEVEFQPLWDCLNALALA
jgi:(p)ppGpp synthase/HD superfamily hydrolase